MTCEMYFSQVSYLGLDIAMFGYGRVVYFLKEKGEAHRVYLMPQCGGVNWAKLPICC